QHPLSADSAVRGWDQVVLFEIVADSPLDALAGDAGPAEAAKVGVLGAAGVVTIEVRRGEVLQNMDFDAHGFSRAVRVNWKRVVLGRRLVRLPGRTRSLVPILSEPTVQNGSSCRDAG